MIITMIRSFLTTELAPRHCKWERVKILAVSVKRKSTACIKVAPKITILQAASKFMKIMGGARIEIETAKAMAKFLKPAGMVN